MHAFSNQVHTKWNNESNSAAGHSPVSLLPHISAKPTKNIANHNSNHSTKGEIPQNLQRVHFLMVVNGVNCRVKKHQRNGIVKTTLGLQSANQAAGDTNGLGYSLNSNRIRRGDCGTNSQGHRNGHPGNPPHGAASDGKGGGGRQQNRVQKHRTPAAFKSSPREFHANSPQKRGQEDRKNNFGVNLKVRPVR